MDQSPRIGIGLNSLLTDTMYRYRYKYRYIGIRYRSNSMKDSCPAFGKKCKNCSILGHFSDQCKKKSKYMPEEHHKPSVKQNNVVIKKMKMKKSQGDNMGIIKSTMRQMKK